ncbi:site-specific integrase [Pseudomonas sp. DOAB1067]|uniref:Site-specific integrase n=2 Tax=Pseudomonas triticifolii TaxID=2762592 RepID=A0ABR7BIU7_9PSED|nr:site-specific integrase [Pseudomonas triticifolii]
MAKFAKPATQAASVMKKLQGTHIRSVGTVRNYEQRLERITAYLQEHRLGSLREMTPVVALEYLRQRAMVVGQKTLDMERQALQAMMQHVTHRLPTAQTLQVIKSTASPHPGKANQPTLGRRLADQSRAYTHEQMALIAARQAPHNALATEISHAAGLRAHELLGLRRKHRQEPDQRPTHNMKFSGLRETTISYTVHGKGGLIREVRIPIPLARRLERMRLAEPRNVKDRGINYQQFYGIGGGQPWSKSVSAASNTALGWSNGAHGLRHTYAQDRMAKLQRHLTRKQALEVVSQEMGHFRPEITEVYLR